MIRPYATLFALLLVFVMASCKAEPVAPLPLAPTAILGEPTPTLALPAGEYRPANTPDVPVEPQTPTKVATETATSPTNDVDVAPASIATPDLPPTPIPCAEPGRVEHGSLYSAVAGEPMAYRVYLPPCYGRDGRVYPTLYVFGGNVHDDGIWDALGLDEAAGAAILQNDIPPLIIVMPDNGWLANTTTSGPSSYEGFVLNELIPHIEATYCAWPARAGRAVGGLSRGGYWSLMMAFRRPDLFRSVGAHSPALVDSHAGPAEDPAITGVTNDLSDLRILIDLGERDPYLIQARPLHEALTGAGVPHDWWVNEGTHEEAYWRANLERYLQWYSDGWRLERESLPACVIG